MSALKRAVDDVMQHQWSNSREAMAALKRLLDAADEAEEVVEVLAQNRRTDGRREWASVGTWLQPGESIVVLRADGTVLTQAAPTESMEKTVADPVAWRTFDGEGGYDYRSYEGNESYRKDYIARNGVKYSLWVEPLFLEA